jgi:predicted DNA-binding protein (UPF0251 family)
LQYLLAQRSLDEAASVLLEGRRDALAPDKVLEEAERDKLTDAVHQAVNTLDETLAAPLRLYFGFGQPELGLRDIAKTLGTTDYRVRVLLVRGLAAVAASVNVQDLLDRRELDVARVMFLEGLDEEAAAARLGLRRPQVKAAIASLQAKFGAVLRHRKTSLTQHEQDSVMAREGTAVDVKAIVDQLKSGATIEWALTNHGSRSVTIRPRIPTGGTSMTYDVGELLKQLTHQPELWQELEKADVDLGWLIAPPPTRERVDRPPDFEEWSEALDSVSRQAWGVATRLYTLWRDTLAMRGLADLRLGRVEAIQRVQDMLAGMIAGLERKLPRSGRRAGHAVLEITRESPSRCSWIEPERTEPIELPALIRFAIGLAGIEPDAGRVLSDVVLSDLGEGLLVLPDYRVQDVTPEWIRLEWIGPTRE